ncbi:MAG TPA: glycosyltransferase family 4 protein [Solirubrobacterales bacterium]|jgi:glycosyltransferase involved in cell wall biosynthesis
MKVLFTLHDEVTPDAGGMGVTAGLANVYRELGHEVESFSFGQLPQRLPFRAKALLFPEFAAWRMSRTDAGVIDAANGDAWVFGHLRRRLKGVRRPLLVTRSHGIVHTADVARREEAARGGLDLSWKYPLYWGGWKLKEVADSLRLADLCLFLNVEERQLAIERLGVDERRARVVDNGLPEDMIGLPLDLGAESDPVRIAHIGSYLPLKGVRYAAAALTEVLERHPEATVSFLGPGCPPERVLGDYPPALHPRVAVVPKYRREEMPGLLARHSVVVSATLKEGFGLGILEGMACGLTAVTADAAGPLQFVRDGENGLVVPRADAAAMAAALELLIADPALLRRLRERAHATAQNYSWKRIAPETLELYAEALERRHTKLEMA